MMKYPTSTHVVGIFRGYDDHAENLQCICGNSPSDDGFEYCTEDGQTDGFTWCNFTMCETCGRIIDVRLESSSNVTDADEIAFRPWLLAEDTADSVRYLKVTRGPRLSAASEDAWHNGAIAESEVIETSSGLYWVAA